MTWTDVRLKHAARVGYGLGQPPDLSENGIPILRATNITRGKFTPEGLIFATKENLPLDRAPLLREGEILVVRSGAYTGDSALVTSTWAGSAPGYDLRVSPMSAEPRYLAYCMLSTPTLDQVNLAKSRAAQPHLNAEDLGDVTIRAPSLDEQRRIADFLDAETARIDQLVALQSTVLEKINQRDRAVRDNLVDALVDQAGELPLRRFVSKIEQGTSPQCENFPREEDRWGVLKLSAVKSGRFYPEENKQLPGDIEPAREYEVRDGDFLVSRANTPELVGDVAIVKGAGRRLLLPDLIYRVRLGQGLQADFAAQVFLSSRVRSLIQATARGSSQSMVKLRGEDIREWPVPRATVQQQKVLVSVIAEQLESSARLRTTLDRQLELLAERRQALITAAVTGQIDVSTAGQGATG